jgi:antitoxin component YwqK of YwqJK toxin-antitoxin module
MQIRKFLPVGLLLWSGCAPPRIEHRAWWYAERGTPRMEGIVHSQGDRETAAGLFVLYHPNGTMSARGALRDVPLPRQPDFLDNETVLPESGREGWWEFFHPNGRLLSAGLYLDGLREGLWEQHWFDGSPAQEASFREGQLHGRQRNWSAAGVLLKETSFVRGEEQGLHLEWDEAGQLREERMFAAGKLTGRSRSFDERGVCREEAHYHDGLLHGIRTLRDADGILISSAVYRSGNPLP